MTDEYSIFSMSGAILQADEDTYALFYEDGKGKILFSGLKGRHPGGGVLYIPSPAQWERDLPKWRGERELVRERVRKYLEQYPGSAPGTIVDSYGR